MWAGRCSLAAKNNQGQSGLNTGIIGGKCELLRQADRSPLSAAGAGASELAAPGRQRQHRRVSEAAETLSSGSETAEESFPRASTAIPLPEHQNGWGLNAYQLLFVKGTSADMFPGLWCLVTPGR